MKKLTDMFERLFVIFDERKNANPEESYVAKMYLKGRSKIAKKVGEEGVEVALAAVENKERGLVKESADLLFHLLLLWHQAGVKPEDVAAELARREGTSGIAEKKSRPM